MIPDDLGHFLVDPGKEPEEWAAMWSRIPDADQGDEDTGERWQYMESTYLVTVIGKGPSIVHTFRHRHHPVYKGRIYLEIHASDGWIPRGWKPKNPRYIRPIKPLPSPNDS